MKLGPLNQTGSMWSEAFSGDTYRIGDRRYVLTEEGKVFLYADWGEGEPELASEADAADVRAQAAEDEQIFVNRRTYAKAEANGNRALEKVLFGSMFFENGAPELDEFKEHPELKIAQVGRNASHSFYLGASEDGRLFKLSIDDYEYYEGIEGALHCREIEKGQSAGYMGHV